MARFYDPYLNHFIQADTIVPQLGMSVAYDRFAYVQWNPIRYTDPSGHDVGCAGYDAGRCSGYNKLSQETIKKRQYFVPPVVKYIYDEIKRNSKSEIVSRMSSQNKTTSPQISMQEQSITPGRKLQATLTWASLVGPGREWDHKPKIQAMESAAEREPDFQEAGTRSYKFDTWSNIHYGFVGKTSGFSDSELLDGAGLAQFLVDIKKDKPLQPDWEVGGFRMFDQAQDRETIQIGIDLWKQYGEDLWPEDIIWAIEHALDVEVRRE